MYENLILTTTTSQSSVNNQQQSIKWTFLGANLAARLGKAVASLIGREYRLQDLEQAQHGKTVRCSYEAGVKSVPLRAIRGSESRSQDFDNHFRPLQQHTQSRWESVAKARINGVALPAVDLVKVGENYYVRDGHHRISVASVLGQESIDAKVVVEEFE